MDKMIDILLTSGEFPITYDDSNKKNRDNTLYEIPYEICSASLCGLTAPKEVISTLIWLNRKEHELKQEINRLKELSKYA